MDRHQTYVLDLADFVALIKVRRAPRHNRRTIWTQLPLEPSREWRPQYPFKTMPRSELKCRVSQGDKAAPTRPPSHDMLVQETLLRYTGELPNENAPKL